MTEIVQAQWIRDQVFILQDRAKSTILMTQPNGVNGADLLPLSVLGCAMWDIVSILTKQHQPLTAFWATAESTRDLEPPWQFRKIHLHYHLQGTGLNAKQVQRAVDLSHQKYCSTYATLRQAVEISSSFMIEENSVPAPQPPTLPGTNPISGHVLTNQQVVIQFNDALNARDLDGMMELMTPDCIFENTYPRPEGTRYEGQAAIRSFWQKFFNASKLARIDIEDIFAADDHCVMRWAYHWISPDDKPGYVRGVDVFHLEGGLISEKLSYVKG